MIELITKWKIRKLKLKKHPKVVTFILPRTVAMTFMLKTTKYSPLSICLLSRLSGPPVVYQTKSWSPSVSPLCLFFPHWVGYKDWSVQSACRAVVHRIRAILCNIKVSFNPLVLTGGYLLLHAYHIGSDWSTIGNPNIHQHQTPR